VIQKHYYAAFGRLEEYSPFHCIGYYINSGADNKKNNKKTIKKTYFTTKVHETNMGKMRYCKIFKDTCVSDVY